MRSLALTCYIVGALAEFGGLYFVVSTLRTNRRLLQEWADANPAGHEGGSYGQLAIVGRVVQSLLDEGRWRSRVAIGLLVLGIIAGTAGNLATL